MDDGIGVSHACKPHIVDKDISGCEFAKQNDEIRSGVGGVSCLADLLHEDGGEEAFLHFHKNFGLRSSLSIFIFRICSQVIQNFHKLINPPISTQSRLVSFMFH